MTNNAYFPKSTSILTSEGFVEATIPAIHELEARLAEFYSKLDSLSNRTEQRSKLILKFGRRNSKQLNVNTFI